jgi:hypothetical protein
MRKERREWKRNIRKKVFKNGVSRAASSLLPKSGSEQKDFEEPIEVTKMAERRRRLNRNFDFFYSTNGWFLVEMKNDPTGTKLVWKYSRRM